eukprot:766679-Hanusia_phi.AAC.4
MEMCDGKFPCLLSDSSLEDKGFLELVKEQAVSVLAHLGDSPMKLSEVNQSSFLYTRNHEAVPRVSILTAYKNRNSDTHENTDFRME